MTWVYNNDVAAKALFCGCRPLAKPHNPLCYSLFLAFTFLYYFILIFNMVSKPMVASGGSW